MCQLLLCRGILFIQHYGAFFNWEQLHTKHATPSNLHNNTLLNRQIATHLLTHITTCSAAMRSSFCNLAPRLLNMDSLPKMVKTAARIPQTKYKMVIKALTHTTHLHPPTHTSHPHTHTHIPHTLYLNEVLFQSLFIPYLDSKQCFPQPKQQTRCLMISYQQSVVANQQREPTDRGDRSTLASGGAIWSSNTV